MCTYKCVKLLVVHLSTLELARWLQTKHSVASWASDPLQVIRCKRVVPLSLWKGVPPMTSPRTGDIPKSDFQDIYWQGKWKCTKAVGTGSCQWLLLPDWQGFFGDIICFLWGSRVLHSLTRATWESFHCPTTDFSLPSYLVLLTDSDASLLRVLSLFSSLLKSCLCRVSAFFWVNRNLASENKSWEPRSKECALTVYLSSCTNACSG